jgi:RecA/RadA recombinase
LEEALRVAKPLRDAAEYWEARRNSRLDVYGYAAWTLDRIRGDKTDREDKPEPQVAVSLSSRIATPKPASLLTRSDGVSLLYRGLVHDIHGPSESGKSWVALIAAVEAIRAGGRVALVDFESNAETISERLQLLGLSDTDLSALDYFAPDGVEPPYAEIGQFAYALVIIDGVTVALETSGVSSLDQGGVAGWYRRVPHKLATETGAAVLLVDHVTKTETTSRFAIGAVAKLAAITGASFAVRSGRFGRGSVGRIRLYLAKDRPGFLGSATGGRSGDLAEIGTVTLDSTAPGRVSVEIEPPSRAQPTGDRLRDNIVAYLTENPGATTRAIREAVTGKAADISAQIDELAEEGAVSILQGPGKSLLHSIIAG